MNRNLKHLFFSQTFLFTSLFLFLLSNHVYAQEGTFEALGRSSTRSLNNARTSSAAPSSASGASIHIVKSNETLYGISRKYDMTVTEIRRMNNMSSNLIRPGDRLKIMVSGTRGISEAESLDALQRGVANGASSSLNNLAPRDQVDMELDILTSTRATYPPPINATARTRSVRPLVPTSTLARSGKISVEKKEYYMVKKGDDIYSIADTYQVPVEELRGWNMRQDVRAGQTIIVKKWYEEIDQEEANRLDEARNARATSTRAIETPKEAAQLRIARAQKKEQEVAESARRNMVDTRSMNLPDVFQPGRWMEDTQADSGPFQTYNNKEIKDLRFYAIHPFLPIGSTVKMELPDNPGYIELVIIGRFDNYNNNAIIGLSPASAKILKDAGSTVVTIRY